MNAIQVGLQQADTASSGRARGKVALHFTMSLDGFIAGPHHAMDWMAGFSPLPAGVFEAYVDSTGAVLCGRDGFDASPMPDGIYGGAWHGPVYVLTHHRDDAQPATGVEFLDCDVAEAAAIGLEAAAGKDLKVLSASIGRQLLERGLVDSIDLHVLPILLGRGTRLFEGLDGPPIRLQNVDGADPAAAITMQFRASPQM